MCTPGSISTFFQTIKNGKKYRVEHKNEPFIMPASSEEVLEPAVDVGVCVSVHSTVSKPFLINLTWSKTYN